MNRTPNNRSNSSCELSFIALEDDDTSKGNGSSKRRREFPVADVRSRIPTPEVGRHKNEKTLITSKFNNCPWIVEGKQYCKGVIGLHQEIEDFFQYITPNPQEHQVRLFVVNRITDVIMNIWPHASVNVFGSFRTGLYLPTSDIDLVVLGKWDVLPFRTLEQLLVQKGIADPNTFQVLDKASVPIVKLTDRATAVKVDISFNRSNGVQSAELIRQFKKTYPSLQRLVFVLKQFLSQRGLNIVFTGGISSYSLIMMVISFLQLHPRPGATQSGANLGVLLIEFFELYGRNFNYLNTAIRIQNGGSYVPKEEVEANMQKGFHSPLCIEDPLNPTNNIGRSSHGTFRVKEAFDYAYTILTQATNPLRNDANDPNFESILGRIIRVSNEVIGYRSWIQRNFPLPSAPSTSGRSSALSY